jgi:hypothetical protein
VALEDVLCEIPTRADVDRPLCCWRSFMSKVLLMGQLLLMSVS